MTSIAEADWKLFRVVHEGALRRFHARALAKIRSALDHQQSKSDAEVFAVLVDLMNQQRREIDRLFSDFRRSTALLQLAFLRAEKLVTDEEFARFGSETRGAVEKMLGSLTP